MTIPVNDLARHASAVRDDVGPAVERVLAKGWYILGAECTAFEREFAAYCGIEHCVGLANGSDALELGLRALGIGAGARVATVANGGFYTSTALIAIGAVPVFVDVDETTHLMNLEVLAALVDARAVDAIVVTHLYGLMHDMGAVNRIAARAAIPVLEDCAQAHGAQRGNARSGSLGHAAAFSFYPTKNLGAVGDAGAVTTGNADVAGRLRQLRQYGWESKYRATLRGGRNSRLDELQAAVLRVKLPYLERWNERRRQIAARYTDGIRNPRVGTPPRRGAEYIAHLYVVTCDAPAELRAHLAQAGVQSDIHYPVPDHLQVAMADSGDRPSLPVTERLAQRIITLPSFPELTDGEVDCVIAAVNGW
jgi:dTDP-4-amino-4,6-dideoxygalactose transaminase